MYMYRDVAMNFFGVGPWGALHKISLDYFKIKWANSFSRKFPRILNDIHFTKLKTNQMFENSIYSTYYNDRMGKNRMPQMYLNDNYKRYLAVCDPSAQNQSYVTISTCGV